MVLLRTAFWLSLVILLIPAAPSGDGVRPQTAGTGDAPTAAQAAVREAAGFCERNPRACAAGGAALAAFGKAQTGARRLCERIGARLAGDGRRERPDAVSQHTLEPRDLEPGWRGPEPKRPAA